MLVSTSVTLEVQLFDHFIDLLSLTEWSDLKWCLVASNISDSAEADGRLFAIVLHLDLAVEHGHLVIDDLNKW